MSRLALRSLLLSLVAITLATGCDEGTAVLVDLRTDLTPGNEFVRVRTEYSTSPFTGDTRADQETEVLADGDADYVHRGERIATFDGLRPGPAFVRVSLLGETGEVIVDRVVTAAVRQRAVMVVVVSRSCRGIDCPGESDDPSSTTCLAGRCVSPECTSESPERCGERSCTADTECTPGAACAVGLCLERECFFVGMDERCPTDQWCDPDLGCRPRAGVEPDGGPVCPATETGCESGTDDDCDGLIGCADPDCAGTTCDDGDACTTDDQCGAAVCAGTAISCDDGNACTTDTCDPATGCVQTNHTEPCDDGFYCNGDDTCQDGACSAHGTPPCTMFCNETTRSCDQCVGDGDCGVVSYGTWSTCGGYADTCDETGVPQTREVHTPRCTSGMCTVEITTESRPCTRDRDGIVCFTSAGTCAYAGACDESQQRTPIRRVCAGGSCPSSGGAQAPTTSGCATRDTDGNSCGSRTRDRCCNGGCVDIWASETHCGGCGQRCESGLTCRIIHAGGTAGDGAECYGPCTANTQCDAPGGSRNCYPVSSGGYGYCQCLDSSGCAAGQTCAVVSGTNYCRY